MKFSHLASTPWPNRILAGTLAVFSLIGMIRVYSSGAKALATLTDAEKQSISTSYDLDALTAGEHANNTVYGKYSLLNTVQLLDCNGIAIPDTDAWYNLVGTRTLTHNTRYLADRLVSDPDSAGQYHVLRGTCRSDSTTKIVSTTLNSSLQDQLYNYLSENELTASLLVTRTATGNTLAAVSTPSEAYNAEHPEDGALINRNFYKISPGSTQKIAALLVIAAAGGDLSTPYECTGQFISSDGEIIQDSGVHGVIDDASGALANSCNCWIADRISKLDNQTVIDLFRSLGYLVNEDNTLTDLDGVPRSMSSLTLNTMEWNFSSVWNVVGEAEVMINPFDLASIASAIETGGEACQPHLLSDETTSCITENWPEELISALPTVKEILHTVYSNSYVQRGFPSSISWAKTGTSEYDSSNQNTGRRLVACTQSGLTFYLAVENYKVDGVITTELSLEQIASDITAILDTAA